MVVGIGVHYCKFVVWDDDAGTYVCSLRTGDDPQETYCSKSTGKLPNPSCASYCVIENDWTQ